MIESIFFRWCKKLWANFPCSSPFVSIYPFQHACAYSSESYKQMPMKYKAVSACKDIYIHIWTVFIYIVIWNYIWQKHIPFASIYLKVASRHSLRSDPDAFEALTASHLKPARDEVERTLVIAKSKDVIALMFFSIYSVYIGNQTQVIYRVYISLGHTLRFCVFRSRENSLNIHWPYLKMTIYTQSMIRYVQGQWYIFLNYIALSHMLPQNYI